MSERIADHCWYVFRRGNHVQSGRLRAAAMIGRIVDIIVTIAWGPHSSRMQHRLRQGGVNG